MEVSKILSGNLSTMRAIRGISQVQFAAELGISKSTLQEIEKGHSPTLDTVDCIAQHLELPASALISEEFSASQTSAFLQLLRGFNWYAQWDEGDQSKFWSLLIQLVELMGKHLETEK